MNDGDREKYLDWMRKTLPEVPEWTVWQQRTGELPPDFDRMPRTNLLPDPLHFLDGRPVGPAVTDWEARRAEIKTLFERWMVGTFPPKPAIDRVVVLDETRGAGYTTRNVRLEFGPGGKASVRVRLVIPDGAADQKFPSLISTSLDGWGATAVRRGYISVGYAGNDRMDDAEQLRDLYPDYDFATLPRRAWLVRMVIDYLETVPQVDVKKIAMYGYSRDGKMALIAAGWDERISALIAGSTGVGGIQPWRLQGERGGGEGLETTTRSFPTWFVPQLRFFAGKEDYLPFDANLFAALIAPRAAMYQWGLNDQVANGFGIEQVYKSVQPVYTRFGQTDRLSVMNNPGFHGAIDAERCFDWLDFQFGRTKKRWENNFVFAWDFSKWRELTGENVNLSDYATHPPVGKPQPKTKAAWSARAAELQQAVRWMLGERPLALAPAPPVDPAAPKRPLTTGPLEVSQGKVGNPGQLAPDVPAWSLAAGGFSYGFGEPGRSQMDSRRFRFGYNNSITGDFYFPKDTPAGKKLPVVIWLHGFHHPLGYMWNYRTDLNPVEALVMAGYAVLAYDQTGYGTRYSEAAPFYDRYPRWSRLGRMVEEVSAAVDALQDIEMADGANISVYGYALGGTVGLYAAALDQRIAGVVSICGFTPMRTDTPDRGMSGMTRYSHQHGVLPRVGLFAGHQDQLPYDYDDLMALVAPRPVLVVQPLRDRDASAADVRAAVDQARPVYVLQGAPDNLGLQQPDDYGRLTDATQNAAIGWMATHIKK